MKRWLWLLLVSGLAWGQSSNGPAYITGLAALGPQPPGTVLSSPNCTSGNAAPIANTAPCASTFNATSATSPFQISGNTWAWFPIDGSSQYTTFIGVLAGAYSSPGAIGSYDTTCVGYKSCGSANIGSGMTGVENTGIGWESMLNMSSGNYNTAVGVESMGAENTGINNTAIGEDSQRNTVGCNYCTSVGSNALRNVSGNGNVAIGAFAMEGAASATGANNVVVGTGPNIPNYGTWTSGSSNVGIGNTTFQSLTSGSGNVSIGHASGQNLTTQAQNVFIGYLAGQNATGQNNTVIGAQAWGLAGQTGSSNTLIGNAVASTTLTTGGNNVIIGTNSSCDTSATSTVNNVVICAGSTALLTITGGATPASSLATFANNVAATTVISNTIRAGGTNSVTLGNVTDGTSLFMLDCGGTCANYATIQGATTGNPAQIRSAGSDTNVGLQIGSKGTQPITLLNTVILNSVGTGANADFLCLSAANVILIQASACTISSLRFKENVEDMTDSALGLLTQLEVASYSLKDTGNKDPNATTRQTGLIAENVAKIAPECAIYEDDMTTPKSYRQECVIALLVKGEQELSARPSARRQQWEIYGLAAWCMGLTVAFTIRRRK